MKSITKVLVANRGEIAIRIMRTASDMGMKTVAVFSEADKNSLFVKRADEAVCIGGFSASESYLDQDKIIAAAKKTGADAIHPGYGFLAENASFAKRCEEEQILFIGPTSEVIEKLGSKIGAKEIAEKAGVPTVPGYAGTDQSIGRMKYEAEEIGFPVLVKASAGGGGKGMRVVNSASELEEALHSAKREAEKSFGDGSLLLEKYFSKAKHIEFQVFGDEHENYIHLFDRECSMQRRYQKVIEESPSPSLTPELREQMGEAAVSIAREVNYTNAGTVEFLLDEDKNYYFLEVNTRLQVEHPVTEMVTGVDIVQMQFSCAMGVKLKFDSESLAQYGHAIECRICAENPENNFFPSSGEVLYMEPVFSLFARLDSGIETGTKVDVHYDSMVAKLITTGENRENAIRQMVSALENMCLLGITTNIDFLKALLQHPEFVDGSFDTKLIEREYSTYINVPPDNALHEMAIAALLFGWRERKEFENFNHSLNGWRNVFYKPQIFELELNEEKITLHYLYLQNHRFEITVMGAKPVTYTAEIFKIEESYFHSDLDYQISIVINDHLQTFFVAANDTDYFVHHPSAGTFDFKYVPRFTEAADVLARGGYFAPMPGEIVKVLVKAGDKIKSGKGLFVMNSMKMETTIEAHSDGEVEEIFVAEKSFVEANTVLLKMKEE
jgi:acetyl-CoA carboxylase biotin carboxylase subunit